MPSFNVINRASTNMQNNICACGLGNIKTVNCFFCMTKMCRQIIHSVNGFAGAISESRSRQWYSGAPKIMAGCVIP